ncbi:MAG: hypothetical protein WCD86_06065 [Ktedonobacteraceae bacterium]
MLSTQSSLSSEILARARESEETPEDWLVLPLKRGKVAWGIFGWLIGFATGTLLFAGLAVATIPSNYHSVIGAIVTTILLGILAFVAIGSAWTAVSDMLRLRDARRHVIIITREDFVKQEGDRIIHVPLVEVRNVTARGKAPIERSTSEAQGEMHMPTVGEHFVGLFAGRGYTQRGMRWRRGRMRTPASLAFIDMRSDSAVTVVRDTAYGDPFLIAASLKQYAAAAQGMGHS